MIVSKCPLCGTRASRSALAEAAWLDPQVVHRLSREHPRWRRSDGACPACVQEVLLETAILNGREGLEGRVQSVWPLDADAAFGAMPTPLRLRADPRFCGRGLTVAVVDAAFFPHPDLVRPQNRIRAWVDATSNEVGARWFTRDDIPSWPEPSDCGAEWHGLMTSVTAAGNGWLSHGLYRGLAPCSDVVLAQVGGGNRITTESIVRALKWLRRHALELGIGIVTLSVAGDERDATGDDPIGEEVSALVGDGVVVVAAAGNDGRRHLVPPATAPDALTVGGLDDHNVLTTRDWELWHSNYGTTRDRSPKPEVVAPSLWTVAPVLPGTDLAREAQDLFRRRARAFSDDVERRIGDLRLVTPHYQHVEGTSFAAPVVAAIAACMREANPRLTPRRVRELLMLSATRIPGAADERQGAGAVDAGLAVAAALSADHPAGGPRPMPVVSRDHVTFVFHDPNVHSVVLMGSWDGWRAPGIDAERAAAGSWRATLPRLDPGLYSYKYLLDASRWIPDPANPLRTVTDEGHVNSVFRIAGEA